MAETTVTVGCRLPHGLVLRLKNDEVGAHNVTLNGLNSLAIKDEEGRPVGDVATTEVNAEFWAKWKSENLKFLPLKNGAIYEANSKRAAEDRGKEMRKERTGFEPLNPKDHGVKKVEKDDDE